MTTPHLLLDIEGTTTAIDYVYSVLFPYADEHLNEYVFGLPDSDELAGHAAAFQAQFEADAAAGVNAVAIPVGAGDTQRQAIVDAARLHMKTDRKTTALKALQGRVWRSGYMKGQLRGHVYDDVPVAFRRWAAAGHTLHIYSSGSVEAQRLIFGHSIAGDLTPLLTQYFDTTTGPKKEAGSYRKIASELGVSPADVTFFTDNGDEAAAARDSGMRVVVVRRPDDPSPAPGGFLVVTTFDGLF